MVIAGARVGNTSFKSHVGMGSKEHDFVGALLTSLMTSSFVTGVKDANDSGLEEPGGGID